MGYFSGGKPLLTPHESKRNVLVLQNDITYHRSGGESVTAGVGTLCKGAPRPWFVMWLVARWSPLYSKMTIIHNAMVGEYGQEPAPVMFEAMNMGVAKWGIAAQWLYDGILDEGQHTRKARIAARVFYYFILRYRFVKRVIFS